MSSIDDKIRRAKREGIKEIKWSKGEFLELICFMVSNGFNILDVPPAYFRSEEHLKLLLKRLSKGDKQLRYMGVLHTT